MKRILGLVAIDFCSADSAIPTAQIPTNMPNTSRLSNLLFIILIALDFIMLLYFIAALFALFRKIRDRSRRPLQDVIFAGNEPVLH